MPRTMHFCRRCRQFYRKLMMVPEKSGAPSALCLFCVADELRATPSTEDEAPLMMHEKQED